MRDLERATLDVLKKFLPICAEVGRDSYNHFVKENTK
jgi:hypothetical protein